MHTLPADEDRIAQALSSGQAAARAVQQAQAKLVAESAAQADDAAAAQLRYISHPTEGQRTKVRGVEHRARCAALARVSTARGLRARGRAPPDPSHRFPPLCHRRAQPPRRRTLSEALRTRALVEAQAASSFRGYAGSLASLNHTIGLSGYPFGADAQGEEEASARGNATGDGAEDALSDDGDGDGRPQQPALVVTAAQPVIEQAVDFVRSARLSAGGSLATRAGALKLPGAEWGGATQGGGVSAGARVMRKSV